MNIEKNKSTNRSFGIVFFIVFLIIGVYPILNEGDVRFWSLIIAVIFLISILVQKCSSFEDTVANMPSNILRIKPNNIKFVL